MAIECLVRKYNGRRGRMAGDIVSGHPSPVKWGRCEGPPKYVIITINDINPKEFNERYKGRHIDSGMLDRKAFPIKIRSKYRFNLPELDNYSDHISSLTITEKQMTDNIIDRKAEYLASR